MSIIATGMAAPLINRPDFYLRQGAVEISGGDDNWRRQGDKSVYRHLVKLGADVATNHLGAKSYRSYAPLVEAVKSLGVVKFDASGDVAYELTTEPYHRYGEGGAVVGSSPDMFWLTVKTWGPGTLKAIKVSWLALTIQPRGE